MRPLLAILIAATCLAAGEAKPMSYTDAGKADAITAFKRQADANPAPTGDLPAFRGFYLWGGRADAEYRPFFQWEFRLQAGTAPLKALRARVRILAPDSQVAATGAWKSLGDVAAGKQLDFSYKLNCPSFPAYEVALEWNGGKASYLGPDRVNVPQEVGDLKERPLLVTIDPAHEYDQRNRAALVTFALWNFGGKPAEDVSVTVRFLDAKGKEIGTHDYKPAKGAVAPESGTTHRVIVKDCKPFSTISLVTRQREGAGLGASGAAAELAVDGIVFVQKASETKDGALLLTGELVNRRKDALVKLVVTFDAKGKGGSAKADVTADELAAGASMPVTLRFAGLTTCENLGLGWQTGG